MSFASAVALTNNGSPVGVDGEANLGHIDGVKGTPDLAAQHATGFNRLAIPAVMSENPIGFGDRVPSFDATEFALVPVLVRPILQARFGSGWKRQPLSPLTRGSSLPLYALAAV